MPPFRLSVMIVSPKTLLNFFALAGGVEWDCYRVVKGGGPRRGVSLRFPKVPQSSLGILKNPIRLKGTHYLDVVGWK